MNRSLLLLLLAPAIAGAKPRHPGHIGPIAGPVALQIHGEDADSEKRRRCRETMKEYGATLDDKAPIQIVITLATLHNYLKVVSSTRGVVFQERLPAWTMEKLCQEALSRGNRAAAAESAPK